MSTATGTYVTLADLKAVMRIRDTDDDAFLAFVVAGVNQTIESMAKRILAPIIYSAALFDGNDAIEDGRCLMVPRGLRTITLLEVSTNTGGSFQTVPATDYFIQPNEQERDPGWPGTELWMTDIPSPANPLPYFLPGFSNIRITGTGGWEAVPDDVADIARRLAVKVAKGRGTGGNGDSYETGSDGARTYSWLLSIEDKQALRRYTLQMPVIV